MAHHQHESSPHGMTHHHDESSPQPTCLISYQHHELSTHQSSPGYEPFYWSSAWYQPHHQAPGISHHHISHQSSAIIMVPAPSSVISHQLSVIEVASPASAEGLIIHQSAFTSLSHQPSAISHGPLAIGLQPSLLVTAHQPSLLITAHRPSATSVTSPQHGMRGWILT